MSIFIVSQLKTSDFSGRYESNVMRSLLLISGVSMFRLFHSPAFLMAGMSTCTLVLLFLVNGRPSVLEQQGITLDENKKWRESVEMIEHFYAQRTYGNPSVNVSDQLMQVWDDIAYTPQSALMKPFAASNTWRLEGPTNIGGRMRAVVFHPTETNTMYSGAASGGVWKSTDLGVSWRPLTDNMPRLPVGAMAIDLNSPNILFAGTGEPIGTNFGRSGGSPYYDGLGVMRSDDDGQTWRMLPWPRPNSAVHRIALHPVSSDTLLVATVDALYKSTDGGESWFNSLNGYITEVLYKPDNPGIVYAAVGAEYGGSNNGIYMSGAGGDRFTWQRLDNNLPPGDSTARVVMSISEANPDRIYAAMGLNRRRMTDGTVDFKGVFVSHDAGATWERKQNAIANNFARGQAFYDLTIMAHPTDPDRVFLGGIDMHRTTNGGEGFAKVSRWELRTIDPGNEAYVHADQHHVAFKPDDPNTVVAAGDGGIFISTNGGTSWMERSDGLVTTQFYGINYAPSNPELLYGGTQDNSNMRQTTTGMSNWSFVGGGDGGRMAIDPDDSNLMYLNINSTPYRTFGGNIFAPLVDGLSGYRGNWVRPMLLDQTGDRLYTASDHVHRLSPAKTATTWLTLSMEKLVRGNGLITDLQIPETAPRMMYSSSSDGKVFVCNSIIGLDTDWFDVSEGMPNRWISGIRVARDDENTVYAALSGYGTSHAWKTTDGGAQWVDISGDLPDIPANVIIPSRTDPETIFLATDLGVWYTTNGGTNWKQFGNGLPNVVCYDMKLTPDNRLIVGTYGRGVWSTDAIVNVSPTPPAAKDIIITSIWPNPLNTSAASSSTLDFSLTTPANVKLVIHDATGRAVSTLVQGRLDAGNHNATFHAKDLPAGTYFAVLRVGTQTVVKKIALLR